MSLLTGLQAYYKLDTDYTSSTGSNDATNTGSTITSGGIINNGSTQSSSYFRSPAPVGTAGSISVWFKKASAGADGMIVGLTQIGVSDFLRIWSFSDTEIQWTVKDESINSTHSSLGTSYHHAVLTWDSSTTWKAYLDGVLVVTGSTSRNPTTGFTIPFGVLGNGSGIWSTPYYQNGILDEIGIWNRQLTSTEITTLYNSGAGLSYPFSTPTANPAFLLNFL